MNLSEPFFGFAPPLFLRLFWLVCYQPERNIHGFTSYQQFIEQSHLAYNVKNSDVEVLILEDLIKSFNLRLTYLKQVEQSKLPL